jgi:hypothetical protein
MRKALNYVRHLRLRHLKKAIAAAVGAGGVVLGKALLDLHVDQAETGLIASAAVGAFVVTFFAPANAPEPAPTPGRE